MKRKMRVCLIRRNLKSLMSPQVTGTIGPDRRTFTEHANRSAECNLYGNDNISLISVQILS